MLSYFRILNFRSLADLSWPEVAEDGDEPLQSFLCLVGKNGAGKSTLLQALSFVSQVAAGNVTEWLKFRGWATKDLNNRWSGKVTIGFSIGFRIGEETIYWRAKYNPTLNRCTTESVLLEDGPVLLSLKGGQVVFNSGKKNERMEMALTTYQGSCLSLINPSKLPSLVQKLVEVLHGLKFLDTLTPDRMRRRTKTALDLGHGGENLSAYVASLTTEQRQHLAEDLRKFFPTVSRLQTQTLKAGWKQLKLLEDFGDLTSEFTNRDLNDGMLRVLAILAECNGPDRICLFDEIENGIHPELAGQLVSYLIEKSATKQIIVTTHNPMILNYIPDEAARKSVHLVYKDKKGSTKTRLYFGSKITADKLGPLGAGEVYVDTPISTVESSGH